MTDFNIEDYKGCSYGELIRLREQVRADLDEYEVYKHKGSHLGLDFFEVPGTADDYRNNLRLLSEICIYMADIYDERTPVVTETDPDSMLSFAHGLIWGDETADIDLEEDIDPEDLNIAVNYLNTLAEQNNAEAMNMLGAMAFEGRGAKQDYEIAVKWYVKAAEHGSSLGMCNAGYCFYYGNGVEIDYEKAYKYFSKSAILGEYDSLNKLGDMYRDGRYVAEDKNIAFQIYVKGYETIPKEVVQDAYPANLLRLGECFLYGWGCEADKENAKHLLKDALEVFELQVGYGRIYAKAGLEKAKKLYELLEYTEEEVRGLIDRSSSGTSVKACMFQKWRNLYK